MSKATMNFLQESYALILAPIKPPPKILKDHARVMILDSVFSPFVNSQRTSHPTIIAFIDFTMEKDKIGRATPGKHHTFMKFTVCSPYPSFYVDDYCYLSASPLFSSSTGLGRSLRNFISTKSIISKITAIQNRLYPPLRLNVWRIRTVKMRAMKSPNCETPFHIERARVSDLLKYCDKTYHQEIVTQRQTGQPIQDRKPIVKPQKVMYKGSIVTPRRRKVPKTHKLMIKPTIVPNNSFRQLYFSAKPPKTLIPMASVNKTSISSTPRVGLFMLQGS